MAYIVAITPEVYPYGMCKIVPPDQAGCRSSQSESELSFGVQRQKLQTVHSCPNVLPQKCNVQDYRELVAQASQHLPQGTPEELECRFWEILEENSSTGSTGTAGGGVYSSVDIPLNTAQKQPPECSTEAAGWELAHCAMDRLSMLRFLRRPVPGLKSPTLILGMQFSMR